jgi:hypothetical protein
MKEDDFTKNWAPARRGVNQGVPLARHAELGDRVNAGRQKMSNMFRTHAPESVVNGGVGLLAARPRKRREADNVTGSLDICWSRTKMFVDWNLAAFVDDDSGGLKS